MTELRAEPLSPIDAATLWPQLHKLSTEVVATRTGERLLLAAGLAATGLDRLPRLPRTVVAAVRRGLAYRGIVVARALAGGRAWELVSLRLEREKDDDAVIALIEAAGIEAARRGGLQLYLRLPEGSPHREATRRAGLATYLREELYAPPPNAGTGQIPGVVRPLARADRAGVFRLYHRAVPERVRRAEAPTAADWRAVIDSYDCDEQYAARCDDRVAVWVGIGEREARVLTDPSGGPALRELAIDTVLARLGRHGTLVVPEFDPALAETAMLRGFVPLGCREVATRRLARLEPLKEAVPVSASAMVPQ
ncbi:MAG: hypothetical protein RMK15_04995 [Chloroflexota bacterium]|jgi:hypothetical protein|nr:hypothetical protein [Dehalococcoidia bacterium]MDW8046619.1 hypothetical protein [Chloroflexota bacterium]